MSRDQVGLARRQPEAGAAGAGERRRRGSAPVATRSTNRSRSSRRGHMRPGEPLSAPCGERRRSPHPRSERALAQALASAHQPYAPFERPTPASAADPCHKVRSPVDERSPVSRRAGPAQAAAPRLPDGGHRRRPLGHQRRRSRRRSSRPASRPSGSHRCDRWAPRSHSRDPRRDRARPPPADPP